MNIRTEYASESLEYRISKDCQVRLLFEGMVTREAVDKLISYLELAKDDFPPRAELLRRWTLR